jgi:hypothetical protein
MQRLRELKALVEIEKEEWARKQGWNVLQTLTQDPSTLIQSLRLA